LRHISVIEEEYGEEQNLETDKRIEIKETVLTALIEGPSSSAYSSLQPAVEVSAANNGLFISFVVYSY